MIFIRFGIVFRIVLFFVFSLTSAAGFASTDFEFVSWFQVQPFGQKMTQVGFDRPVQSQSMPAFGFASDQFDPTGNVYFYRWDLWNGTELEKVTIPPTSGIDRVRVYHVALTPDNKQALLASNNMEAILFDVEAGREISRYSGHRSESVYGAISPSTRYKAVATINSRIWVWQDDQRDIPAGVFMSPGRVESFEFLDTESLIRVYQPGRVQVWNWQTGVLINNVDYALHLDRFVNGPFGLSVSPDRAMIIGVKQTEVPSSPDLNEVIAVRANTGEVAWRFNRTEDQWAAWSAVHTPNGKCVVVSFSSDLYALDPTNGHVLAKTSVRVGSFSLAIDPSEKYLIYPEGVEIYELPDACK